MLTRPSILGIQSAVVLSMMAVESVHLSYDGTEHKIGIVVRPNQAIFPFLGSNLHLRRLQMTKYRENHIKIDTTEKSTNLSKFIMFYVYDTHTLSSVFFQLGIPRETVVKHT